MAESRTFDELAAGHCEPCEKGTPPLTPRRVEELLGELEGWELSDGRVARTFKFKNHHQVMAFVNAIAWISHRQNHHPDLEVGYNTCRVNYFTHAIDGLSENDFICAARVEALLAEGAG